MRQSASDAEYFLKLLIVVNNDDVTAGMMGDVVAGVG